MEAASRTPLVALAVLAAVAVPLVIVVVSGSGEDAPAPRPAAGGLRVEQTAAGLPEISVYLKDRSVNDLGTTGGATSVVLECEDRLGRVVFSQEEPWPFSAIDGGTVGPHAHVGMSSDLVERIARCRLKGTDPPLEGRRL